MHLRNESDLTRHRLSKKLLLVSVAFAVLYGFLMVNFVDSTYSPSNVPNAANGTLACTYPSTRGCDVPGLCATMQNCVDTNAKAAPQSALPSFYHFWLVGIYFAPFVLISVAMRREHWELMISLGLLVWFVNDGLWGFYHMLNVGLFSVDPSGFAPWAFGSSSPPQFWDCPRDSNSTSWDLGVFSCWAKNWWAFSPRNLFKLELGGWHPIVSGQLMTATLLGRLGISALLLYKWQGIEGWTAKSWRDVLARFTGRQGLRAGHFVAPTTTPTTTSRTKRGHAS